MNNRIVMKVNSISNEIILAAADKEILGKNLREGILHLEIKEDFYGSSPVSKALFLETMSICTIANLVGNYTVRTAIEAKFIDPDNVIEIEKIKHCQYAKMIRPWRMIALLNKNEENVKEIFKVISTKYDLIDSIMSFGMDNHWRKKLIESLKLNDGQDILDVGCGSGKISYAIENEIRADHIYAMDITKEMFPFNKESKVQFIEGSAMSIPLEDKCVNRVVSGFLTRNVPSLETYMGEVYRVLKPGGIFCNLDIFDPKKALIAPLFRFYFYRIVPIIFDKMSGTESYSYLARSVQTFVSPASLNTILLKAGFSEVTFKRMAGGTVFIHTAIK